jgi:6,7-dimethyl-8-ribityllumazine synthase
MHNKGPAPQLHDGSNLRVGIVHARWNDTIIDPLLAGATAKLQECGVKESNIVVQTVPGSWELPIAVQRYVDLSQFCSLSRPSPCQQTTTTSCVVACYFLHYPKLRT